MKQPPQLVHLGFEVGTGKPVSIPVAHMAVTGQTQQSGKTTAMEALISRSGRRAIAFVTKRGEGSFGEGRRIRPYFRERADWQFVESILESTMRQRMKFERAWIVRATRGAKTLADVQRNVEHLQSNAKRSMDADIYMLLGEYLDLVVPLLAKLPAADTVDLRPGLNVMDLGAYPAELQALVIQSVLAWIYQHERDVIAVIPEAWQFVPQGRGAPVKLAAIDLARKGAGLGDFMWLDSQDLAGVEKEVVRQASVWLLGVQREANEIKRTLAHIPAGIKKPKPGDIATLGIGQFWVCWANAAIKTYVWPAWMSWHSAEALAFSGGPPPPPPLRKHTVTAVADWSPRTPPTEKEGDMNKGVEAKLDQLIALMAQQVAPHPRAQSTSPAARFAADVAAELPGAPAPATKRRFAAEGFAGDEEELYQRFKVRLMQEAPTLIKLLTLKTEIEVLVERRVIMVDGQSLRGRLAKLIADNFFDVGRTNRDAVKELGRTGKSAHDSNVLREIRELISMGFLHRTPGDRFQAVSDAKVNVVESGR
jgi:hypothetical protein